MPNKLIIKVHKEEVTCTNAVRIDQEAMDLLKQWQSATNYPLACLASKMIKYAAENIEIVEE